MKKTLSKWKKLMRMGKLLGCHQMPCRSFFYKRYQFPLCARCTGVILGYIFSFIMAFIYTPPLIYLLFFLFIMGNDWLMQYIKIKKSTNIRRLITGFLGGYGLMTIYIIWGKFLLNFIF